MRILYKQPGQDPSSMVIQNELGVMQQLVGGNIETKYRTRLPRSRCVCRVSGSG